MRFLLFVEGETEKRVLGRFLKRWLDKRLKASVRINVTGFQGCAQMWNNLPNHVKYHRRMPDAADTIGFIGIMDLYGPDFYPDHIVSSKDRKNWAITEMTKRVNDGLFRMFFAVHELEAWLLSDPGIFPSSVRKSLPGKIARPEEVNFNEPPAKLIGRLFREKMGRNYLKIEDGVELFSKLDPDIACARCPSLDEMLKEMLLMAKHAGL
ncbi:MAG: DUF4276 family protein [Candidatus Sumerlaeota bacterium]|nr:DUF4276 family protein [Candidatus Sumerlaeota bacterium]